MKKFLVLSLLALSLFGCGSKKPEKYTARLSMRYSNHVYVGDKDIQERDMSFSCTSSQLKYNENYYIITAKHCLETSEREMDFFGIKIKQVLSITAVTAFSNGKKYELNTKNIKLSTIGDVAVVKLDSAILEDSLSIADSVPAMNEPVTMHGYPLGVTDIIDVKGLQKSMTIPWFGGTAVLYQLVAAPGNSGGAILNSKGEMVSILVAGETGGSFLSFGTTLDNIKNFLNSLKDL